MTTTPNEDETESDRETPVPSTIVCFDRDHTVSVNPHPEKRSVPLAWVKYLAHEVPTVDVWATGNQLLREEASIPGIAEGITCWRALTLPHAPVEYHAYVPTGARLPGRREGLQLLRAVYDRLSQPEQTYELVVIDDVDLTDLETDGWTHYFPWDFVTAVESGTGPVDVPVPLEKISNTPLTDPNCPESYPPIDYDEPGPLQYR